MCNAAVSLCFIRFIVLCQSSFATRTQPITERSIRRFFARRAKDAPVELCPDRLIANVRRARKGAAPGPSGCTGGHLRVLLDDEECAQLLVAAAGKLASAQVPDTIIPAIRLGRMVVALADRPELAGLLPYVALLNGSSSVYVFYDEQGRAYEVRQGEGGEQGDPLMPCLFALGQHKALLEVRARLHPSDTLYAFLDDIYVTGSPDHTASQFGHVREAVARYANIQVRLGHTRAWNSAGEEPPGLLAQLPSEDPANPCWTGSWALAEAQQGVVVLGSPVGSRAFVTVKLTQRLREQDRLLQQLLHVPHLQSAWLLLLYCAAPRCTYLVRTVPPSDTADFAAKHDAAVLRCLARLAGGMVKCPSPTLAPVEHGSPSAWADWDSGLRRLGLVGGHPLHAGRAPPRRAR